PSFILNALSKEVARTLNQSTDQHGRIKDGMDLALCCIHKDKSMAEFAGAYNPLYIIRDNQLIEFKSDRLQIGSLNYTIGETYTNTEIKLCPNDVLYLFSDGFVDQKGGLKRKKFYYQPFRDLLLKIHHLPMDEQRSILKSRFIEWKGDLEQTDDMCIIGVRV
ncbi:MAG: serine/threonine-protein phosphatase, partial [Flavobacteriales bacterium]|nr:serine/threonine-protein phosphatase [Flavobacteriales bacterium]